MKKFLFLILALGSLSAGAATVIPLSTLEQVEKHCPKTSDILFNQETNNSGKFNAQHNSLKFNQKLPHSLPMPANDIQLLKIDEAYGFITNHITHCFYTYTGIDSGVNTSVQLEMQSAGRNAKTEAMTSVPLFQYLENKSDNSVSLEIQSAIFPYLKSKYTLNPHTRRSMIGQDISTITILSVE